MKTVLKLMVLLTIMFITGCGATGVQFQRATTTANDKGVVYVYRPDSMMGAAIHYDVHVGKESEVICDLVRGGYCLYYSKPGELELWGETESRSSITIDVKAGQEHFVKGSISLGFLVGRPNFTLVEKETGLKEIVDCKLLLKPNQEAVK